VFRKVLIANRGEIVARVAQTLQQMGIVAVAVYSEPDRRSPHVAACDEAYSLDGRTSAETYLRGDKIIDIARSCGADAIHPGYGFLSENAEFAEACGKAGVKFIGPSPKVIRGLGDKVAAKEMFAAAGVPVVPGWSGKADAKIEDIKKHAATIGFPVLIKATAGGGGKGIRVVENVDQLAAGIEAARREAEAAFGDGRVFIERYVERPRHVEFQVFGDEHGNVVHLFERECSIQRRHQKIIEESPSPALNPALRERMGQAAVTAARVAGYTNAGTVEFLVDASGDFYFLEVNTRLQVEHPVTEMVVHHDLVRAQVLVAAGQRLPFEQESLRQDGHAIECRIYAEDPSRQFVPSTGTIEHYAAPAGPGIRVDSGVLEGSEVSVYYDPMLAKLILAGRTRMEAIDRAIWALERFVIMGVKNNVAFLRDLLMHDRFRSGELHTGYLEEHRVCDDRDGQIPDEALIVAALAAQGLAHHSGEPAAGTHDLGPWEAAGRWRAF